MIVPFIYTDIEIDIHIIDSTQAIFYVDRRYIFFLVVTTTDHGADGCMIA